MINIIKTKLENKANKTFNYFFNNSKIVLEPGKTVTINGDIFSKDIRQEGSTENLLVNVHNGDVVFTLVVDDKFINNIERESLVVLPRRAQERLIVKDAPKVEEPKVEPKKVETKVEPKVEEPKVETKVEPKVEPKKVETKVVIKEEAALEHTELKETKKEKKSTKL